MEGTSAAPPERPHVPPMLEYKKDGTLSKMRAHKGNIPVLPQTKLCPHCPARFTRTTHLNRHLRTHSNEKLYHCDTCPAQFTRSDLLTRHKRSCNEVMNANRVRRKSCRPCAESKIKCDLALPCAKCTTRGKDCVYAPASRARSNTQTRSRPIAPNKPGVKAAAMEQSPLSYFPPITSNHAATPNYQSPSNSPEITPLPHSASSSMSPEAVALHLPSSSPGAFNVNTAPRLAPSLNRIEPGTFTAASQYSANAYHHDPYEVSSVVSFPPSSAQVSSYATADFQPSETEFEGASTPETTTASHLSALYATSGNVFQPFFSQVFAAQPEPESSSNANEEAQISTNEWQFNLPQQSQPSPYPIPHSPSDSIPGPSPNGFPFFVPACELPDIKMFYQPSGRVAALGDVRHNSPWPDDPPPAETQHYMYLFFSAFSHELPIVHQPTFRYEGKPEVLLRAMQACGAIYVKTKKAARFIANTLIAVKEIFLHEFSKNITDVEGQTNLILAVVLVQTIGLFHERSDLRASSNLYHARKVAMIRRTGLFRHCGSWAPSTQPEVSAEALWRDWAHHEVIKRTLLLSYMHDNINNIYFALPATYSLTEIEIHLPSEDTLWDCRGSADWFALLQTPSPYGSFQQRLTGVALHKAIHSIGQTQPLVNPYILTPFGHFVVIHAFLAQLFCFCVEDRMPLEPGAPPRPNIDALIYRMQYCLFNWYRSWEASPDMPKMKPNEEPPFIQHALQFYWLGQIALLAHQEGLPPFEHGSPDNLQVDHRFRLVGKWLKHIRKFLCRPGQEPTKLWQELMGIRLQAEGEEFNVKEKEEEEDGGILSFWPEH